jgi:large subunit ribosomal protein L13
MKTFHPKLDDMKAKRQWYIVDAEGQVLGKVAERIAVTLRGKNKPEWHPSVDCGDNVIVINAAKVVLTGNKENAKEYITHSGYPGGIKRVVAKKMRQDYPERIIEKAVAGMISRNRLKKFILKKLHVYGGSEHPHAGQNPQALTI